MSERVFYAIGDVHGEADRLARMHDLVLEDAARLGLPATIIHLGDLVDRGPDSRAAVELAMALADRADERLHVITLKGNHEQMLVDAVRSRAEDREMHWFANGGHTALASYLRANGTPAGHWSEAVDRAHVRWLSRLPTSYFAERERIMFVHAGIEPQDFPRCAEEVHLWTRSRRFFEDEGWPDRPELEGLLVVHGHTPTASGAPDHSARRINLDTGAVYGGPLSAVALVAGEEPRFFAVPERFPTS